jgi:DNA-directed RNA polymerase specialized sigma24 family protein
MSSKPMDIQTLQAAAARERSSGQGEETPAALELFRRAFAGDQEAWGAIQAVYEPLMRSWIGTQRYVEPDDVLQEAFLLFYRFAPQCPNLTSAANVGPLLAYLRKSTKTALLLLLRQQQRARQECVLASCGMPGELIDSRILDAEVELRLILRDCAHTLIKTSEEKLVFRLHFSWAMKPQEIQARHADLFADVASINTIIQRLARRFRKMLAGEDMPRAVSAGSGRPLLRYSEQLFQHSYA